MTLTHKPNSHVFEKKSEYQDKVPTGTGRMPNEHIKAEPKTAPCAAIMEDEKRKDRFLPDVLKMNAVRVRQTELGLPALMSTRALKRAICCSVSFRAHMPCAKSNTAAIKSPQAARQETTEH